MREGAVRAVPKAATHLRFGRAKSHKGLSRTAPLGPYRHTTATPHAAVRISMRYRLCAGGYLWCCADCVRCGALRVRCAAGERRERDRHRCRWVGIAAGWCRHRCRDGGISAYIVALLPRECACHWLGVRANWPGVRACRVVQSKVRFCYGGRSRRIHGSTLGF